MTHRTILLTTTLAAVAAFAQPVSLVKSLQFREIGPTTMGGRVDDFAVVESNPNIMYAGTASGGVFKTVNGGNTWVPVFDDQPVSTIGDVTVSQSEPDTVWVGTGESNNRQSSSWGNGVYKSLDGGKTWENMGLKDSHHIGRILIHPTNPNVVYVAAAGHLWGPNEERGVFKTTDGGKTWAKVLYINPDTGVNDIAMDPQNPDTIYAGAYQRRRTVFGFNGGGPGSGLYRTTDGGATWKKLATGLPTGEMGRIAVDVYRRNGNIVYALVESSEPGLYRSDDKGETWKKMSNTNPRPMYFSQVRIDPNNDQRIWVAGVQMSYSEDGGKTFVTNLVTRIHVDFHAIWIDPANSSNMIVGCDGGIHLSKDRGKTWDSRENIAIAQFYEVAYDMKKPYNLCGGLQDNNTWCGPSATLSSGGIRNNDWYTVQGGDGFYAQIDPVDSYIVYAESQDGNIVRRDLRTHEAKSIRPREADDKTGRYRFQWNSPMLISKHDRKTIYYGGNYMFKSTDQGDSWRQMGPDLTNNTDRRTLSIMGRKVEDRTMLSRNDGVANFPAITTIAESSVRAGIMWAGTDDGNLQVSKDGETWKNVVMNVPGLAKGTYVSRIIASASDAGTAYVTFDGHRGNDFSVYIYKTTDYGDTWKDISNGLPKNNGTLHVIREHPKNPNLLFAGTEYGLFVSFDRGDNWQELKNNLPRVPVFDLQIHPRDNDLIIATHGRSLWIMDSISALEKLAAAKDKNVDVFDVRPATMWRIARLRDFDGHDHFVGANPPVGAIIDYYVKNRPAPRDVKIRILDKAGKQVRAIPVRNVESGVNRIVWDLHYDRPTPMTPQEEEQLRRIEEAGGGGGGFGPQRNGPSIDPGEYTVEIAVGSDKATTKVVVEEDPRIDWFSAADRAKRRTVINELVEMTRQADGLRRKFQAVDTQLTSYQTAWKRPDAPKVPDAVKKQADELKDKLGALRSLFVQRGFGGGGPEGPLSPEELAKPEPDFVLPALATRIQGSLRDLESVSAAPTKTQLQQIDLVKAALADATKSIDKLVKEDVAKFNKAMTDAQIPYLSVPER